MPDIKTVTINDTVYDIKDETARNSISDLESNLTLFTGETLLSWDNGKTRNLSNVLVQTTEDNWASVLSEASEGDVFYVKGSGGNNSRLWIFADSTGAVISYSANQRKTTEWIRIVAPEGASYLACNSRTNEPQYVPGLIKGEYIPKAISTLNDIKSYLDETDYSSAEWKNGTPNNSGNLNYICMVNKQSAMAASVFYVNTGIELDEGETLYALLYTYGKDETKVRDEVILETDESTFMFHLNSGEHFFNLALRKDLNGTAVPLRVTDVDVNKIHIIRLGLNTENNPIRTKLLNARHVRNNATTPLTILHLSDVHADSNALKRIVAQKADLRTSVDDIICTGDLVLNSGGAISSWWNSSVMTCVGNHDSATYSNNVYDWTGVSMADRDAYYIAPFESNWGVVHTAGTSYYYKDYTTQNVRLIVMDGMLYMGTPGAEATAQTAWLENLLSDAITNNLHVLIAIHAAHGGATVKECTFSQLGTHSVAPSYNDCNTPQIVIDTVAAKITAGLKFIGYIIGHEHKDFVYDAENDGSQLMFCVTCANTSSNGQWKKSDQYRDSDHDAYNLVTIDTANTLVKIVRGGGADVDDRGRNRKYICINYSTGQIVGEIT